MHVASLLHRPDQPAAARLRIERGLVRPRRARRRPARLDADPRPDRARRPPVGAQAAAPAAAFDPGPPCPHRPPPAAAPGRRCAVHRPRATGPGRARAAGRTSRGSSAGLTPRSPSLRSQRCPDRGPGAHPRVLGRTVTPRCDSHATRDRNPDGRPDNYGRE